MSGLLSAKIKDNKTVILNKINKKLLSNNANCEKFYKIKDINIMVYKKMHDLQCDELTATEELKKEVSE